jgi:protoheme ferro-lyase
MRHRRKPKFKRDNDYYRREQELNRKIRDFQNKYYDLQRPSTPAQYREMDMLRREIKYLLSLQGSQVWQKSYNRKHAYFDQLTLFKSMYMMWQRDTAFTYIEEYHDVPHHISMWARDIGANQVSTPVFGT